MAKRIMIVDDDPYIIQLLQKRLEANRFEICCASSGKEAIAMAKDDVPDLILMDIMMPGMDGTETARIIKEDDRTAKVPIIYLTALKEQRDDDSNSSLSPNVIFAKPFDAEELVAKIREVLGM